MGKATPESEYRFRTQSCTVGHEPDSDLCEPCTLTLVQWAMDYGEIKQWPRIREKVVRLVGYVLVGQAAEARAKDLAREIRAHLGQ